MKAGKLQRAKLSPLLTMFSLLDHKGIKIQMIYMPVISQAINLPCTDTYLGYTVIPRHDNDLNKHKTKTQTPYSCSLQNVHPFTTRDLWVREVYNVYCKGVREVIQIQVTCIFTYVYML